MYAGRIAWPWAWDRDLRPGNDIHLWTIAIEFAHAMLLFLVLLALASLRTRFRQTATVLLAGYCLACGRWAGFEFLTGLFLAEVRVLRSVAESRRIVSNYAGHDLTVVRHAATVSFHSAVLATCLFVAGWPNEGASQTAGIKTLLVNTPTWLLTHGRDDARTDSEYWGEYLLEQKFWSSIAAVLFVWSYGELATVPRHIEHPLAQYCGRISYAMYLVHGPALDYWKGLADGLVRPIGMQTAAQRTTTWLVGLLVLGSLMVWLADLFWRYVDAHIVALGRAVEQACIRKGEGKGGRLDQESKGQGKEDMITIVVGWHTRVLINPFT
jgi:peptidoglycan/LPS O-acetylase OafA/YrhL